jgi:hypothetical protein
LTIQQASTEVRLLWVVARQLEAAGVHECAPTPFLVLPPALPPEPQMPPQVVPPSPDPLPFTPAQATSPNPVHHHTEPGAGPTGAAPVVPLEPANFSKPPVKPVELEPAGGNCPRCDSAFVFLSKARSPFELQLGRWKIPLCRCHRCYHRYFVFAGMKIPKQIPASTEPRVAQRRKK